MHPIDDHHRLQTRRALLTDLCRGLGGVAVRWEHMRGPSHGLGVEQALVGAAQRVQQRGDPCLVDGSRPQGDLQVDDDHPGSLTGQLDLAPRLHQQGFDRVALGLGVHAIHVVAQLRAALAVGLDPGATPAALALGVAVCVAVTLVVFLGYMLVFSQSGMMRAYQRVRRWIDAAVAGLFALAGLALIRSAFSRQV